MITLNNAKKQYKAGESIYTALDVSLHIDKGEFVIVTGRSGSGKSTLLNILAGIDRPTTGDVVINGESIVRLTEDQMAQMRGKTIGIVFQFFQLIPNLTALENILLAMELVQGKRKDEQVDIALSLLNKVSMRAHANKLPAEMSGGEQQRVAIARALANRAPVFLADEPTGNLDSSNAAVVIDLLNVLANEGKTIVMVTHEREPIEGATRQIVLQDGHVAMDLHIGREN